MEPTAAASVVVRVAARVLLIDQSGCLLLFRALGLAGHEAWVPVGGAVEVGEELHDCAVRELFEETGQRVDVGEVVACTREQHLIGELTYDCFEHVFVARTSSQRVDVSRHTTEEQKRIRSYRWWPLGDVGRTEERFFPADLPALVAGLVSTQ